RRQERVRASVSDLAWALLSTERKSCVELDPEHRIAPGAGADCASNGATKVSSVEITETATAPVVHEAEKSGQHVGRAEAVTDGAAQDEVVSGEDRSAILGARDEERGGR